MISGPIFISYSRSEYYYAESVALRLAKQGIATWFDTQRIAAGDDWEQGINAGLAECGALVLIASRAALASTFVREEWTAALAQGKPVYVLYFEAVTLPPELRPLPALDGRIHFERKVGQLAALMTSGEGWSDPPPRALPFGLPTRLPFDLALGLALMLMVLVLDVAVGAAASGSALWTLDSVARANPAAQTANVFVLALLGALWLLCLLPMLAGPLAILHRRSFSIGGLLAILGLAIIPALATLLLAAFYPRAWVSESYAFALRMREQPPALLPAALLFGPLVALNVVVRRLHSPAAVRWYRPGTVNDQVRQTIYKQLALPAPKTPAAPPSAQQTRTYTTYTMLFEPCERIIAAEVRHALGSSDNALEERQEGPVDYTLIILTQRTPRERLRSLLHSGSRVVAVIGTSVSVPEDDLRRLRLQWFDYRTRNQLLLAALREQLAGARPDPRVLAPLPEGLEVRRLPLHPALLLGLGKLALSVILGAAAFLLTMSARLGAWSLLGLPLIGCAALLGVIILRAQRWRAGFGALAAGTLALLVGVTLSVLALFVAAAPDQSPSAWLANTNRNLGLPGLLAVTVGIGLALYLLSLPFGLWALRRWAPASQHRSHVRVMQTLGVRAPAFRPGVTLVVLAAITFSLLGLQLQGSGIQPTVATALDASQVMSCAAHDDGCVVMLTNESDTQDLFWEAGSDPFDSVLFYQGTGRDKQWIVGGPMHGTLRPHEQVLFTITAVVCPSRLVIDDVDHGEESSWPLDAACTQQTNTGRS